MRRINRMDPRPNIAELNPEFPTRTKGVEKKSSFCEELLAKAQFPVCVEACPRKAMIFGDLNDSNLRVRELLRSRYNIRRKPELGTRPEISYIV